MQRNLRNLAIALVAGTFAITAGAQDEGKKASSKKGSANAREPATRAMASLLTVRCMYCSFTREKSLLFGR